MSARSLVCLDLIHASTAHAYVHCRNHHPSKMEKKAPRKQKQSRASLGDLVSYAAFLSDSQRLKELVCRGAKKLPRLVDSHGCTALHVLASVPGSGEMMEWMLENSGIEVDKADRESLWTALHRSIYYGNVTAAISLIKVLV